MQLRINCNCKKLMLFYVGMANLFHLTFFYLRNSFLSFLHAAVLKNSRSNALKTWFFELFHPLSVYKDKYAGFKLVRQFNFQIIDKKTFLRLPLTTEPSNDGFNWLIITRFQHFESCGGSKISTKKRNKKISDLLFWFPERRNRLDYAEIINSIMEKSHKKTFNLAV